MMLARTLLLTAIGLLAFGQAAPAARADDKGSKVQFQVLGIRATKKNSEVSPELKRLAELLKKRYKFTGFTLVKRASESVGFNDTMTVSMVDGCTVKITPQSRKEKQVRMVVEIQKGRKKVLRITATGEAGRTQFYAADLDNGDALIIAITPR